eukprot:519568-Hanusia_phi.AAC.1
MEKEKLSAIPAPQGSFPTCTQSVSGGGKVGEHGRNSRGGSKRGGGGKGRRGFGGRGEEVMVAEGGLEGGGGNVAAPGLSCMIRTLQCSR